MELFDSHVHLGSPLFGDEVEQIIKRAHAAGVTRMVTVGSGYGLGGNERAIEIATQHEDIYAAIGVHPHEADQVKPGDLEHIASLTQDPAVVAWGEIGLDFFRDRSPREVQRRVFREQIRLARALDLPMIIHTRDAAQETLQILDEEEAFESPVLIHCFNQGLAFAKQIIERGGFLSVPGVVTYKNAGPLREALASIPNEILLLETDGPYLTPVPHRGERNEPAHMVLTAQAVADAKGLSLDDVARASTEAAQRFFRLTADKASQGAVAYQIRDAIYVNPTNRCSQNCTFCHKFIDFSVAGHYLNLRGYKPTPDDMLLAIALAPGGAATRAHIEQARLSGRKPPIRTGEVVFVGYGEPTQRLEAILETARRLKEMGVPRIRLDTDGLANLREGRDVVPEIAAAFDAVTVSINAPDAGTYEELCPGYYGQEAWQAAVSFLESCVEAGIPWVQGSVVGVPGLDIDGCRELIEGTGARFRERVYHILG